MNLALQCKCILAQSTLCNAYIHRGVVLQKESTYVFRLFESRPRIARTCIIGWF